MKQQNADFYGMLLVLLMFVTIAGLLTTKPSITGYAVKEAQQEGDSFFDVQVIKDDPRTCADGSLNGECSSIIKPKYCLYGTLVDYCELCGCDTGEVCENRECVKAE
jgi:hypothetical protein